MNCVLALGLALKSGSGSPERGGLGHLLGTGTGPVYLKSGVSQAGGPHGAEMGVCVVKRGKPGEGVAPTELRGAAQKVGKPEELGRGVGCRSPGRRKGCRPFLGSGPGFSLLRSPGGAQERGGRKEGAGWVGAADALRGSVLGVLHAPPCRPGSGCGSSGGAAPPPRPCGRLRPPPPARSPPARARRSRRLAARAPPRGPHRPAGFLPRQQRAGAGLAPTMRGQLWLLVLVLRGAARALSPQPGAGRSGRSWPAGPGAGGAGGQAWARQVPAGR